MPGPGGPCRRFSAGAIVALVLPRHGGLDGVRILPPYISVWKVLSLCRSSTSQDQAFLYSTVVPRWPRAAGRGMVLRQLAVILHQLVLFIYISTFATML